MRTRIFIIVMVMCCALTTVFVAAHHETQGTARLEHSKQNKPSESHSPRPPSRWWASERYKQELKLTAEQSAEIERIVQGSMARMKDGKEALDRAQTDFRQLMEKPAASKSELLNAAERLEMARFIVSKERTTMLVRIHNVLTPDQRKGLEAISKRSDSDRNRPR